MKNPNTEVASVSDRNWSHEFSGNKLTHCKKYHRKKAKFQAIFTKY